MKKKLFLILVLAFLLVPKTSFAVLDQRCWVDEDCTKFRKDFGSTDVVDGFYSAVKHEDAKLACNTNADGKDFIGRNIGFCLPAGESVTSISFGGRTKFSNIGDFIKFIYQYAFIVGSVIAVMVIIVAGVMYIFSGGNSNTVSQAKKKIYGAIIGLVLMALSYTILKTINPYLVNLRLPSIWAINTTGIAPVRCEVLDTGTNLALAKLANSQSILPLGQQPFFKYGAPGTTTLCGNDYYVDKTNGQTCLGNTCVEQNNVCIKDVTNNDKQACKTGKIGGKIYSTGYDQLLANHGLASTALDLIGFNFWEWIFVHDAQAWIFCSDQHLERNGTIDDTTPENKINEPKLTQNYLISYSEADVNNLIGECHNKEFLGFAIAFDMNIPDTVDSELHLVGMDKSGNAVDLCGMPEEIGGWFEDWCKTYAFNSNPGIPTDFYITKDQLLKGFTLDIDVSNINYLNRDPKRNVEAYSAWWR